MILRAAVLLGLCVAAPAAAQEVVAARYDTPTARYGHGALAGGEWGELVLQLADGRALRVTLPDELVFEDTAPRLVDLSGDGQAEVVVVESHSEKGARLAVWTAAGRMAAGPFAGLRHRWLAPLGAADFDSSGQVEFAYVLRPHLDATLMLARLQGGALVVQELAAGLPSHRYRAAILEGGIADCAGAPVILTADAGWRAIVATRLQDGAAVSRALGDYAGSESFDAAAAAMGCSLSKP